MYAAEGIIARQRWGTVVIRYPKIVRRRDPVDIIAIAEIPGAAVAMAGRLVETAGRLGLGVTLAPRRLLPIKAGGRFSETDFPPPRLLQPPQSRFISRDRVSLLASPSPICGLCCCPTHWKSSLQQIVSSAATAMAKFYWINSPFGSL